MESPNQFRYVLQRFKLNSAMLMGVIFGLFSGVILGLAFVQPAHAQFFNNAQTFVQNTFKGSGLADTAATGIIGLVMNTLRLLFVMYVLFGIVQVLNAVRQGEEWKDLAKTPVFVVLAGTLGDVLVGAIVGSTGATTTPPVTILRRAKLCPDPKFRQINQMLGSRPSLGPIPAELSIPWGGIFLLVLMITRSIFVLDWYWT